MRSVIADEWTNVFFMHTLNWIEYSSHHFIIYHTATGYNSLWTQMNERRWNEVRWKSLFVLRFVVFFSFKSRQISKRFFVWPFPLCQIAHCCGNALSTIRFHFNININAMKFNSIHIIHYDTFTFMSGKKEIDQFGEEFLEIWQHKSVILCWR